MNEIEIWCKHFFFPRILLLVYVNECIFCWDNVSPNIQRSKVDVVGTTWIHSYGFKNDNINKPIVFKTKHEWDIFNRFSRSISSCCPDFFCHLFFLHHLSMICSTCFKKIFIPTKDTKYSLTNFFCTFIAALKKLETLNLNCFRVRSCVTIRANIRTGIFCQAELQNPFEIESEVWTNAHSNCFPQIVLNSLKILLPKLFLVASSIKFSFFVSFHSKIVTKTWKICWTSVVSKHLEY